jgi:hypothetical protein
VKFGRQVPTLEELSASKFRVKYCIICRAYLRKITRIPNKHKCALLDIERAEY